MSCASSVRPNQSIGSDVAPGGLLAGVRVLDFTPLLPGPYVTVMMADLGADVIKVEPPAGDFARRELSVLFNGANRNKRSLAIDLKVPASRAVVERLARWADVAIEAFRPGAAEGLGIAAAQLRAINPRLVYCSLSGYGQTGPWRLRSGHDLNYLAAAGGLAFSGQWNQPPTRPSLPMADLAGATQAAVGILAALLRRERSGEGATLDFSLFEGIFSWAAARHGLDPDPPPRGHLMPTNDLFDTADGKRIALGIVEEHFWRGFCAATADLAPELSDPRYGSSALRRQYGDELSRRLRELIASRPAAEWIVRMEANDVPFSLCVTPFEAAGLEQIAARGCVAVLDGKRHALFPGWADGSPAARLRSVPPALGQHSREVLAEIGFSEPEVTRLLQAGAVLSGGKTQGKDR